MKNYAIIFSPVTFDGIEKACEYYEKKQTGLGKRFATVRYDDIRCAGIKKFPYLVHYHINEDEQLVTILSVYSTYKEPLW